jgi:hypothetical protein
MGQSEIQVLDLYQIEAPAPSNGDLYPPKSRLRIPSCALMPSGLAVGKGAGDHVDLRRSRDLTWIKEIQSGSAETAHWDAFDALQVPGCGWGASGDHRETDRRFIHAGT